MSDQTNSMTWLDAILALWSRWPWVLAAVVLGAGLGLGLFATSSQVYQARAEIVPTVAGSVLQPGPADLNTWRADPQLPQIGAHLLRELALSGEAVSRVVEQLEVDRDYTADEFAKFLTAQVQSGQADQEPSALWLLARAPSLAEARQRANLWADVVKAYVDQVARKFVEEAQQLGDRQLAAASAELEAILADWHQAMDEAQLAVRDQEMFLLRQRYGQHLAQLASLSLLIEIAEAQAQAQVTVPTGADAEYVTDRLAARGEALEVLQHIVAETRQGAEPSFGEKLTQWDQQLKLERSVLRELEGRLTAALDTGSGPEDSRRRQAMVARSLAAAAERLGILLGEPGGRSPAVSQPLDALVRREWKWEPPPAPTTPTRTDDEEEEEPVPPPRQPDPMLAPIWIPPLMFPADIVSRADSPQLLVDNIRAAKVARDRIQAQLIELRQEMEQHDAATADHRWKVDQARQRYENAREAYYRLARRVQEIRLANLQTGGFLQITSRADRTGEIVSSGAYVHGRTGAILGLVVACLVILLRAAVATKRTAR